MNSFSKLIRREQEIFAGLGTKDRTIIADSQNHSAGRGRFRQARNGFNEA